MSLCFRCLEEVVNMKSAARTFVQTLLLQRVAAIHTWAAWTDS